MRESRVKLGGANTFTLPRDVRVTIIPAGHTTILAAGQQVTVMQALGGTATVTTARRRDGPADPGGLDRLRIRRARAKPRRRAEPASSVSTPSGRQQQRSMTPRSRSTSSSWGWSIGSSRSELPSGGWRVDIDMSVTAPFCGMGDIMRQDLHDAVAALPGVEEVEVSLVFDPPWDASRISDVARLELGMM